MAIFSNIGTQTDLLIKQGGTLELRGVVQDNLGAPIDITDCVFTARLKKNGLDTNLVAQFAYEITDAVNGLYRLFLSAEETALINCGELITDTASQYVWDLEMTDTALRVIPLNYGSVAVYRNV